MILIQTPHNKAIPIIAAPIATLGNFQPLQTLHSLYFNYSQDNSILLHSGEQQSGFVFAQFQICYPHIRIQFVNHFQIFHQKLRLLLINIHIRQTVNAITALNFTKVNNIPFRCMGIKNKITSILSHITYRPQLKSVTLRGTASKPVQITIPMPSNADVPGLLLQHRYLKIFHQVLHFRSPFRIMIGQPASQPHSQHRHFHIAADRIIFLIILQTNRP